MALAFHFRDTRKTTPARVALFPGAWNPPTVAHAAIAKAALRWADEVVYVLPRAFPHKAFGGATFDQRRGVLIELAKAEPGFSAATTTSGLFAGIASEARGFYGPGPEIGLLCGRDAAERIASWDYGRPGVFEEMLSGYPLLVASRAGEYRPPFSARARVVTLDAGNFDNVSSTEVRRRMAGCEKWAHLVPLPIVSAVAGIAWTTLEKEV